VSVGIHQPLAAPFIWFGGKSRAASLVWERFGDVQSYVEPFAGSLAVLLGRPHAPHVETVNDADGLLVNAWRGIQFDPEATAHYADWIVSEADLHARHAWLVAQRADLTERLMGDPDFFDAKAAGYWLWGINCWIGSGWCSGNGPWIVQDGRFVDSRQLGMGRESETPEAGVNRKRPHLTRAQGVNRHGESLLPWFTALSERLRRVRVCCGDWSRVMGDSGLIADRQNAGILLDPPYSHDERAGGLYAEDHDVAAQVRHWALTNGDRKELRIALCGYQGEHDMPESWTAVKWHASGGYDRLNKDRDNLNKYRETIWFSPGCLKPEAELPLFAALNGEAPV